MLFKLLISLIFYQISIYLKNNSKCLFVHSQSNLFRFYKILNEILNFVNHFFYYLNFRTKDLSRKNLDLNFIIKKL